MRALREAVVPLAQIVFAARGRRLCPRRVCFLHIQKTAGSAVNGYFKDLLGSTWHGQAITVPDGADERRIRRAQAARYVGGHYAAPTLARFRDDAYAFTCLRDPVARMISAWRFYQGHDDPAYPLPFDSLPEALAAGTEAVRSRFDNPMTRQLAIASTAGPAEALAREAWLDTALQTLEGCDRVCRQERFEADFRAVLADLGLPAPEVIARRNVTDDPGRRSLVKKALPPIPPLETFAEVAEPYLALDRALVDAVAAKQAA